jgi:hypothetical protein
MSKKNCGYKDENVAFKCRKTGECPPFDCAVGSEQCFCMYNSLNIDDPMDVERNIYWDCSINGRKKPNCAPGYICPPICINNPRPKPNPSPSPPVLGEFCGYKREIDASHCVKGKCIPYNCNPNDEKCFCMYSATNERGARIDNFNYYNCSNNRQIISCPSQYNCNNYCKNPNITYSGYINEIDAQNCVKGNCAPYDCETKINNSCYCMYSLKHNEDGRIENNFTYNKCSVPVKCPPKCVCNKSVRR